MTIESSKEIERLFYQDVYTKKKIGSNVYRKIGKGSPNARVRGGVRFSRNNFKRYEKNSRVKEYNIYENILPYQSFKTLSREMQSVVLNKWLSKHSRHKIYTEMGISEKKFEKLLDEMNIVGETMALNEEQIKQYKQKIAPSRIFKSLPADIKYELVDHYQTVMGMTNAEMADKLDYALNTFTTQKSLWKKEYQKRREFGDMSGDDFLIQGIGENDEQRSNEGEGIALDQADRKQSELMDDTGSIFSIRIGGEHIGKDVKDRMVAISELLSNNRTYRIVVNIDELDE